MDISAIVNVSISVQSALTSQADFNTLLLLSHGTEITVDTWATYTSLAGVLAVYANRTLEYNLAAAYFGQNPPPSKIIIACIDGAKDPDAELAALMALGMTQWFGVMCAWTNVTDADLKKVSVCVDALSTKRIHGIAIPANASPNPLDPVSTTDTAYVIAAQNYVWTFQMYDDTATTGTNVAAWFGRLFSQEPGVPTWAFKTLAGQTTSDLSDTAVGALDAKHCNYYITVAGNAITYTGQMSDGQWIDVMAGVAWLQNAIQTDVYSLLKNTAKVPFTDAGIAMVCNTVRADLKEGVNNGVLASYEMPIPKASDYTSAQRGTRVLNGLTFTAVSAGAVNKVQIVGTLTF